MWKCPKCSFKSKSHTVVMKHYYKKHPSPKAVASLSKGKQKKVYTFKPLKRRK